MDEESTRTLTVATTAGLSNRLRVLFSGMALAEATGRQFTMLWPQTVECAASFDELFATPWPVHTPTEAEWQRLRQSFSRNRVETDLLAARASHLHFWTSHSLLMPRRFPDHEPLLSRMAELLAILEPTEGIVARIAAFQSHAFRPRMIGVHLRRGDLKLTEPVFSTNTQAALLAVDVCLRQYPDAGILLCTDDGALNQYSGKALPVEGVRDQFLARYGDRVVFTTPRSLDRREPTAIQDALVDLWLLRQTNFFVGTAGSSFSDLVMLGRSVPVTMCQSQHPLRHLLPLRHWLRGERPLKWLVRYYWRLIRPRGAR